MRSDALERRNRIIEVASKEVAQKGKYFNLEEIASKAGVGVATLYRNFPTRNALVLECVFRICDSVCAGFDAVVAELGTQENPPSGSLWRMVQELVPGGINVLVPTLIDPAEEQLSDVLLERKEQFVRSLSGVMSAARDNGLIHESVPDNWVLNGLIQLYQPNLFDFTGDEDFFPDRNPLIAVFLEGCERGVEESIWFAEEGSSKK